MRLHLISSLWSDLIFKQTNIMQSQSRVACSCRFGFTCCSPLSLPYNINRQSIRPAQRTYRLLYVLFRSRFPRSYIPSWGWVPLQQKQLWNESCIVGELNEPTFLPQMDISGFTHFELYLYGVIIGFFLTHWELSFSHARRIDFDVDPAQVGLRKEL